jgi:membrane-bound lytic murein transglycosylase D
VTQDFTAARMGILIAALTLGGCQVAARHLEPLDSDAPATISTPLEGRLPPAIHPSLQVRQAPDLWRNIRDTFAFEHNVDNPRVQAELAWFARHPKYLQNLRPRLEQHLAYIHQRVVDRGLPGEIALLPIVESALDPYAFSPGGAAGLWQFIPATGRRFGLDRNWWYDGRRDPIAATEAALDYLESLHRRFDDWSLALAGYNAGEGNVIRALRRKGSGATFWELKLPRETSAYVPRLLALAEVIDRPSAYGITLPEVDPDIPFVIAATGGQLDLSVAAAAAELDVSTLYRWNPALNQWSTPPEGPHYLIVPKSKGLDAETVLASIPQQERVRWLRIKVKNGDTLSQLAQRYRTDVTSLRQANNLSGSRIHAGQALLIPKSPDALSNPVATRTAGSSYKVRDGDSLWTISRSQGVSMSKLMRANHVGPKDVLRVGQTLTIPGSTNAAGVIRKVRYGVRKGDSLAKIASKFNVKVSDISSWNNLNVRDYLQPGQSLTLYVDVVAGE